MDEGEAQNRVASNCCDHRLVCRLRKALGEPKSARPDGTSHTYKCAGAERTCLNIRNGVDGSEGVGHAAENLQAVVGGQVGEGVIRENGAVDELHEEEWGADNAGGGAGGKDARDGREVAVEGAHDGCLAEHPVSRW